MHRRLELDPADVPGNPADRAADPLQRVELHPDVLTDTRTLDELYSAPVRREIEQANPEAAAATPANSDVKAEGCAIPQSRPQVAEALRFDAHDGQWRHQVQPRWEKARRLRQRAFSIGNVPVG